MNIAVDTSNTVILPLRKESFGTGQVADYLRTTEYFIKQLCDSGAIRSSRIGKRGKRRISREEVIRLLGGALDGAAVCQNETDMSVSEAESILQVGTNTIRRLADAGNNRLLQSARAGKGRTRQLSRESVLATQRMWGLDPPGTKRLENQHIQALLQKSSSEIHVQLKRHHSDPGHPHTIGNTILRVPESSRDTYITPDYRVWHAMLEQGIPAKIVRMVETMPPRQPGVQRQQNPILYAKDRGALLKLVRQYKSSLISVIVDAPRSSADEFTKLVACVEKQCAELKIPMPSIPTPDEVRAIENAKLWEDRPAETSNGKKEKKWKRKA